MAELHPCPACQRHAASTESSCPFCGAALPRFSPRDLARGRFSRAAVFAGAALATASCGGKAKPDGTTNQQIQSDQTADAGVDAAQPVTRPDPDHNIPKPYGAPPARRRVV